MRCSVYSVLQCVAVCCSIEHLAYEVPGLYVYVGSDNCAFEWECIYVLQCVAVFCGVFVHLRGNLNVLQCVTVCCNVLQCVTVCHSVLQCVAVCCSVLQCVAVCCNVLQYRAPWLRGPCPVYIHRPWKLCIWVRIHMCCSVLQCVAVCCSVEQLDYKVLCLCRSDESCILVGICMCS